MNCAASGLHRPATPMASATGRHRLETKCALCRAGRWWMQARPLEPRAGTRVVSTASCAPQYAAVVKLLDMDIQVTQKGVSCDSGTGLPADLGRGSLKRPTAGSRRRCGQSTPTRTQSRTQRQKEPQTAKEEHTPEWEQPKTPGSKGAGLGNKHGAGGRIELVNKLQGKVVTPGSRPNNASPRRRVPCWRASGALLAHKRVHYYRISVPIQPSNSLVHCGFCSDTSPCGFTERTL